MSTQLGHIQFSETSASIRREIHVFLTMLDWKISGFGSLPKKLPISFFRNGALMYQIAGERFKQLNGTTLIVGCSGSWNKSSLMLAVAVLSWIPLGFSYQHLAACFRVFSKSYIPPFQSSGFGTSSESKNEGNEPTKRSFEELIVLGYQTARFKKGLLLPSLTLQLLVVGSLWRVAAPDLFSLLKEPLQPVRIVGLGTDLNWDYY